MSSNAITTTPLSSSDISELDHIELLFFAYRDFIADADRILEHLGFGRAHHRVLFFINRKPGLMVAELLDILGITKQSLARVLKQLIDTGYVLQVTGEQDRRQRLLFPTNSGRELIMTLSLPQSRRIKTALRNASPAQSTTITSFLQHMTNASQLEK